ncbi:fungal-specific transcription factor domain-containing protein [Geopyxis carbonaria]|nr:fungal-specific transcription factor domain-containing protein [Geopyxis carbonaria]
MEPNTLEILDNSYPNRRHANSTNRKRPKVKDEDRKRIAMACDHCRNRKIKCTGKQPCRQCQVAKISCTYPPNSAKIVVPEVYIETLQKHISALDKCLRDTVPDSIAREELLNQHGLKLQATPSTIKLNSMPISPRSAYGSNPLGTSGSRSPTASQGDFDFEDGRLGLESQIGKAFFSQDILVSFLGNSTGSSFLEQIAELLESIVHPSPDAQEEAGRFGPFITAQIENLGYLTALQDSCDNVGSSVSEPYTLPLKSTFLSYFETFLTYSGPGTSSHPEIAGGIYHWFSPVDTLQSIESLYKLPEMYESSLPTGSPVVDFTIISTLYMGIALGLKAVSTTNRWLIDHQTETNVSPVINPYLGEPGSQSPETSGYSPHAESVSTRYPPTSPPHGLSGASFFSRAKLLLGNPIENTTRPCMRVLALMAFYLLADFRCETGYMYIGLAVRIAVTQGLHRTSNSRATAAESLQDMEERKREFWNIYILDRLYSCVTGTPVMLCDEDIDVDLPSEKAIGILPSGAGLAAHARLSQIMGDIVSRRPFLILAVKKRMVPYFSVGGQRFSPTIEDQANICIGAARRNISLTRQLASTHWLSVHSFTDFYYTFNAGLTLILSQLLIPPDYGSNLFSNDSEDIRYSISYLSDLRRRGNESAGVCANILVKFSAIVQKILAARMQTVSPVSLPSDSNLLAEAELPSVTMNQLNCFQCPDFGEQQSSLFTGQCDGSSTSADLYGQRTLTEMHSWLQTSGSFDR